MVMSLHDSPSARRLVVDIRPHVKMMSTKRVPNSILHPTGNSWCPLSGECWTARYHCHTLTTCPQVLETGHPFLGFSCGPLSLVRILRFPLRLLSQVGVGPETRSSHKKCTNHIPQTLLKGCKLPGSLKLAICRASAGMASARSQFPRPSTRSLQPPPRPRPEEMLHLRCMIP